MSAHNWTHEAHGNLNADAMSLKAKGQKVQHVRNSVVTFNNVRFVVSTSTKYQNIRNGGKRAVCAWLRGSLASVEPVQDAHHYENSSEWLRVSFNPVESDKLFHVVENGQRGAEIESASSAVYVASDSFDNPTRTRVYIKRTN